jgi:hypothetical protein
MLEAVFRWATGSVTTFPRQAVWLAGPTLQDPCRTGLGGSPFFHPFVMVGDAQIKLASSPNDRS